MTQEDKDLLLKDLCARLPYGIKFPITVKNPITSEPIETIGTISDINRYGIVSFVWDYEGQEILVKDTLHIKDVKPYLFPLSSMTEEQKKELYNTFNQEDGECEKIEINDLELCIYRKSFLEFLNKYHFDWMGLIPNGLALDVTGLNIY